jgi:CheY-like chemotaxis protein
VPFALGSGCGYEYEIATAQSVDGALGILEREHFDLILLDMVMPGIGDPLLRRQGLDVLKRIRQLGVNAPIIMMRGDYDSRKEADALGEGAFGYLHKPFDRASASISSSALSRRRLRTSRD